MTSCSMHIEAEAGLQALAPMALLPLLFALVLMTAYLLLTTPRRVRNYDDVWDSLKPISRLEMYGKMRIRAEQDEQDHLRQVTEIHRQHLLDMNNLKERLTSDYERKMQRMRNDHGLELMQTDRCHGAELRDMLIDFDVQMSKIERELRSRPLPSPRHGAVMKNRQSLTIVLGAPQETLPQASSSPQHIIPTAEIPNEELEMRNQALRLENVALLAGIQKSQHVLPTAGIPNIKLQEELEMRNQLLRSENAAVLARIQRSEREKADLLHQFKVLEEHEQEQRSKANDMYLELRKGGALLLAQKERLENTYAQQLEHNREIVGENESLKKQVEVQTYKIARFEKDKEVVEDEKNQALKEIEKMKDQIIEKDFTIECYVEAMTIPAEGLQEACAAAAAEAAAAGALPPPPPPPPPAGALAEEGEEDFNFNTPPKPTATACGQGEGLPGLPGLPGLEHLEEVTGFEWQDVDIMNRSVFDFGEEEMSG